MMNGREGIHGTTQEVIRVAYMEQGKPNSLFGETNGWFTYSFM